MHELELIPTLYADDSEVGPCRGCVVGERCGPDHLACSAFRLFVGGWPREKREAARRKPTRRVYDKLFSGGEDGARAAEAA